MTTANRYPDRPQVGDKIETVFEPHLPGEVTETKYDVGDKLVATVRWPGSEREWTLECRYVDVRVTERAR